LLDGDGLWRRTFGERRSKDRRADDNEDSAIIHLPFLDEHFGDKETPSTDGDTVKVNDNKSDMTTDSDPDSDRAKASSDAPKKLTAQEQARLLSLRNMLDASNARYEQASKKRRPIFAAGLKVRITEENTWEEPGSCLMLITSKTGHWCHYLIKIHPYGLDSAYWVIVEFIRQRSHLTLTL